MKRVLLGALVIMAVAACTPREMRQWQRWYRADPEPAAAFARCVDRHPWAERRDGPVRRGCLERATTEPEVVVDEPDHDGETDTGGVYWPWNELAECESGGNWSINTGNGYYGGLQFALGSWQAAGGSGYPHHASPSEQVRRGEILQDMQGWSAWPTCARIVGLL